MLGPRSRGAGRGACKRRFPSLSYTTFVAYTLAGGPWARFISVQMAAWQLAGLHTRLVGCLDAAAMTEGCVHAEYAIDLRRSGLGVGEAKFSLAASLAERGLDGLFMEMDVFVVAPVAPLLAPLLNFSIGTWGHNNNPGLSNIGAWYARGEPAVAHFFSVLAAVMVRNNATEYYSHFHMAGRGNVFDQDAFNCCLHCWDTEHHGPANCNNFCRDFDLEKWVQ